MNRAGDYVMFEPAGTGLVQHRCPRYGLVWYVSSPPDVGAAVRVPGCGCVPK